MSKVTPKSYMEAFTPHLLDALRRISSEDASDREYALQFLTETMDKAPMQGVTGCALLMIEPNLNPPDYMSAIVFMEKFLTGTSTYPGVTPELWCQMSRDAPDQRELIINSAIEGLKSQIPGVPANAALVIGKLQERDRGNFMTGLTKLWEMVSATPVNPGTFYAGTQGFKYVFMSISKEIKQQRHRKYKHSIQKLFQTFVEACLSTLDDFASSNSLTICGVLEALTEFLPLKDYYAFDSTEIPVQARLFQSVEGILRTCQDFNVFVAGCDLCLRFIIEYYESENLELDGIARVTGSMFEHPNSRCASYAFEVWNEILRFEQSRVTNNQRIDMYNRCKSSHSITSSSKSLNCRLERVLVRDIPSRFGDVLIRSALTAMKNISPDNQDAEDKEFFDGDGVHVFATSLLTRLVWFQPKAVLDHVRQFFEAHHQSEEWPVQHALVLAAGVLCRPQHFNDYGEFLSQEDVMSMLLRCASCDILHLAETSLWAIGSIIKEYGIFLDERRGPQILEIVSINIERGHEIVADTAMRVLLSLAERHVRVSSVADQILSIINRVLNANPTPKLIQTAFQVQEVIVERVPKEDIACVFAILNHTLQNIQNHMMGDQLLLIAKIYHLYYGFCEPIAASQAQVLDIVIRCLEAKNEHFEDALRALTDIVGALGRTRSADPLLPHVMRIFDSAVTLGSPSIAAGVLALIGETSSAVGSLPPAELNRAMTWVYALFNDRSFMDNNHHLYPVLALSLGKLIGNQFNPELCNSVIELYNRLLNTTTIDPSDNDQVKFANNLYECIISGCTSIIKFAPTAQQYIAEHVNDLFQPATKLALLPSHTTGSLFGFCVFYRTAAENKSSVRGLQAILQRSPLLSLLLWGESSGHPGLTRIAGKILSTLK